MPGSKTARRSTPTAGGKVTDETRVRDAARANSARLIPLDGGRQCYFREPISGKLLHLRTDSEAFIEALRPSCSLGLADRIREELVALDAAHPTSGWDATLARLEGAGIFDSEGVGAAA